MVCQEQNQQLLLSSELLQTRQIPKNLPQQNSIYIEARNVGHFLQITFVYADSAIKLVSDSLFLKRRVSALCRFDHGIINLDSRELAFDAKADLMPTGVL